MATQLFHRHTRKCIDAAVRRALDSLAPRPCVRDAFVRLSTVVHARSDLLRTPPARDGSFPHLDALVNLARFHREALADPYDWSGASGHPMVVVHALAGHLLGRYPTPRFLASVWFGTNTIAERARRNWFVQHARGRRFRSLTLPIAMTRRMEHAFLRSPHHLDVDRALRRAEVIGLGGRPELGDAVIATHLGRAFEHPDAWREAIAWLVGCGDELDVAQVAPIVEHLRALGPERARPALAGRALAAVWTDVQLSQTPRVSRRGVLTWSPSRWQGLVVDASIGPHRERWQVVELLDSDQLAHEGRAMRHCVGSYVRRCAGGFAAIWSLRRVWIEDAPPCSSLTIEVDPKTGTIVQLKGRCNSRPSGRPLEIARDWAAREGLGFDPAVDRFLAGP